MTKVHRVRNRNIRKSFFTRFQYHTTNLDCWSLPKKGGTWGEGCRWVFFPASRWFRKDGTLKAWITCEKTGRRYYCA